MKNNKNALIVLILIGFVISCSIFKKNETAENSNKISNVNSAPNSPPIAKAECPKSPISVNETKDKGLEKYQGCLLSVQGKIWSITNSTVTLIDTTERTDYNHSLSIGGSFSSGIYNDIALKISQIKINQQLDKLPTVTFTGNVEKNEGYTTLKNATLSDFQR